MYHQNITVKSIQNEICLPRLPRYFLTGWLLWSRSRAKHRSQQKVTSIMWSRKAKWKTKLKKQTKAKAECTNLLGRGKYSTFYTVFQLMVLVNVKEKLLSYRNVWSLLPWPLFCSCTHLDLTRASLCSPEQISRDVCSEVVEHNFRGFHHWQFTEYNSDRGLINSAY